MDGFSQFKAEPAAAHAVFVSRLTLMDEKVSIVMKKSEELGATLLLLPWLAVLEEEERFRQKRENPHSPDARLSGSSRPKRHDI
ncbi:MAG: hypothetical protein JO189_11980 [Deltaproteobacteria bacterium]|nr:hypothetical protein [Deltaproteobacteria bacterium]